jgi:hypothetical protein
MNENTRWIPWMAALILFMSLTGIVKVILNGKEQLDAANHFLSEGNMPRAVDHFERAVGWYLPGWSVQTEAAAGMRFIADTYEERGEIQNALDTYRLLRGAIFATRSFFTPHQDLIALCNDRIATLMAKSPPARKSDEGKSFEERRRTNLEILSRERSPHSAWALVAEAGFFGWVGAVTALIVFGFSPAGDWRPKPAWTCAFLFLVFYAVWMTGLMKV